MARKPPIMNGYRPIKEYNLDDPLVRKLLGIANSNPARPSKISDRYVVYSNNKRAIVEYKTSSMHKAVEQLLVSAELLVNAGNQVDYLIIVGSINPTESKHNKQEHGKYKLIDPSTNNRPYAITVLSHTWEILIFNDNQVNNMYEGLFKYLSGG